MRLGIFAGIIAGMCWGTVFLMPAILKDFSPLAITSGRYILYGVISFVLLIPSLKSIISRLNTKNLSMLLKLACAGNIFYYILASQAVQLVGVAPTALLLGLVPVTATLFAKSEYSLPISSLIGPLVLIIIGMLFLNTDVFIALSSVSAFSKILGMTCALVALALWTWYAIANAKFLQVSNDFSSNEWSLLFGTITGLTMLIIMPLIVASPVSLLPANITTEQLYLFAIASTVTAIIPSLIGNIAWNISSKHLPISLAGQMIVFETIFALLYGFIYEQRFPRELEILAITCLISGVVWAVRKHR
jgi:drug/metabolite transporter (DMT)-like permease